MGIERLCEGHATGCGERDLRLCRTADESDGGYGENRLHAHGGLLFSELPESRELFVAVLQENQPLRSRPKSKANVTPT